MKKALCFIGSTAYSLILAWTLWYVFVWLSVLPLKLWMMILSLLFIIVELPLVSPIVSLPLVKICAIEKSCRYIPALIMCYFCGLALTCTWLHMHIHGGVIYAILIDICVIIYYYKITDGFWSHDPFEENENKMLKYDSIVWNAATRWMQKKFYVDGLGIWEGTIPGENNHHYEIMYGSQTAPDIGLYVQEYDANGNEIGYERMLMWSVILRILMENGEEIPINRAWEALVKKKRGNKSKAKTVVEKQIELIEKLLERIQAVMPLDTDTVKINDKTINRIDYVQKLQTNLYFWEAIRTTSERK